MSVVPMKMLTVAGPVDSIDEVLCTCLVNEQFQPMDPAHISNHEHMLPMEWHNHWQELLDNAEKLLTELHIEPEFRDFRSQALTADRAQSF